jgi:hypothetical protein
VVAALERARQPDLPEIDHFAPCKSTVPERRGSFRTVLADSGLASRLHHDRVNPTSRGGPLDLFNEMRGSIRAAGRVYSDWQQRVVDIDDLTPILAEFRSQ